MASTFARSRHRVLSTRTRLTLLVGAVLAPLLVAAAAVFWSYANSERERSQAEAVSLAGQIADAVDRELTGLQASLEALATSPTLKNGDFAAFYGQAKEMLRLRGDYLVVRDASGQQLLNTRVPWGTPLRRVSDPVLLETDRQVFATGSPAVSDLFLGAVANRLVVVVDVPVFRDGNVAHVVSLSLFPESFRTAFSAQGPDGAWTAAIIDRQGRIVARSRRHDEFVGNKATEDLRRNTTGARGWWIGTTLEGEPVLGAYARSRLSDWRVAVGVPLAVIEAPFRTLFWLLVAGGAVMLAVSALLAARFAYGIGRPIQALASAAGELGGGKLMAFAPTGLKEADAVGEALVAGAAALRAREADLRASEERYRALFEVSPQVVWFGDANGTITYRNRYWHDYTGLQAADTSWESWASVVHPEHRDRVLAEWNEATRSARAFETEIPYRRATDGAYRWFLSKAIPIRDAQSGAVLRWIGIALDIHERKLAETAVAQSEANLRALADNLPALCWMANADGGIFWYNARWYEYTGTTPADMEGWGWQSVHDAQVLPEVLERWTRSIATGLPFVMTFPLKGADGVFRPFLTRVVPVRDGGGRVLRWFGTNTDVTDERRAAEELELRVAERTRELTDALHRLERESAERAHVEEQLRQAQKMEAVGRLTGGVAHDFNNFLTVVTGNLEMIQRRLADAEPRVRRGLDHAMEGAKRAATLTHRLLAFSRQQPLAPETLDANKLVAGMSDLLRRTLGENIAVETVLAGGLWRTIADANQLESAILNLAVNARDAMPDGGKLTIETANAHLDEEYASGREEVRAGQYVMVAVCDTGTGMTPEVVARAFDPFFTTKPVGKGTGLGLAQVYGFMKQTGGHVSIYSESGHGTTVKLYFPRQKQQENTRRRTVSSSQAPPPLRGRGETILVVEDEPMVRDLSVAVLEEAGYRVISAEDGPSGLATLDQHADIVLLFTDVVLTGPLNGRQVADEALRRRPDLRILFTTGYTRNAIMHHQRLDDDVELVSKPFTAASLLAKVAQLLGTRAGSRADT